MAITLKAARINANMTQEQAAEKMKVTTETVRNWETGKTFPNVLQIKTIESTYGVSYCDINFLPKTSV